MNKNAYSSYSGYSGSMGVTGYKKKSDILRPHKLLFRVIEYHYLFFIEDASKYYHEVIALNKN